MDETGWQGWTRCAPWRSEARDWRCVPVYAVSCLVVAAALYYAVERPFLKVRDRREGRPAAVVDEESRSEPAL